MRPVAIANTIVRMAKAYALHLGGDVFAKIFEVDVQAPARVERHQPGRSESSTRLKQP
jgi:hypothetical protein